MRRRALHLLATLLIVALWAGLSLTAATTTLPVAWSAGGLDAGNTGAGQSARMARDPLGNLGIVSGPANGRELAVTAYTAEGLLSWRRTVAPSSGTFQGDWIAFAPNGDWVAAGHNVDSSGNSIAVTVVRYAGDGTLRWRSDIARTRPRVARLLVDATGDSYLAISSLAVVQTMEVIKHNATGAVLWSQSASSASGAIDIATSLALGPDGSDVILSGNTQGGAQWTVVSFNSATGVRRWSTVTPEGPSAADLVIDGSRVYVTGQGVTGAGTPSIRYWLTVVAYDRASGARLWRTDSGPAGTQASGRRIALAPDGSLAVAGTSSAGGYLDWWIAALDASGSLRWQTARNAATTGDETPASVFFLLDGTAVVAGIGGPVFRDVLGNSYLQGVISGYSATGVALWEGFARLGAVWAVPALNGDVCATGGYDALVTCWAVSGSVGPPAAPSGAAVALAANAVTVSWVDNSNNESTFTVERAAYDPNPGVWTPYVPIATLTANTTSYLDAVYVGGTSNYRIRASNASGDSAYSNVANLVLLNGDLPPAASFTATPGSGPAPLTVTLDGSASSDPNGPILSWTWFFGDGTIGSGAVVNHVYTTPGNYVVMLMVMASRTHIIDTTTRAVIVNVPPPPTAPTAPSGLTAAPLSRSSVRLGWTNTSTSQTEVRIERCRGANCTNFAQIAVVAGTSTTFTDTGLSSKTAYTYRIRAANAVGVSPYSNTATATTTR